MTGAGSPPPRLQILRRLPLNIWVIILLAGAGLIVYLVVDHGEHASAALPYVGILAFAGMHLFGHKGHGGHAGHGSETASRNHSGHGASASASASAHAGHGNTPPAGGDPKDPSPQGTDVHGGRAGHGQQAPPVSPSDGFGRAR